ncbi:MAG: hypothetical protein IT290_04045 [Deltaproteobacteria bacterium]|nr:hypothetical protein [Deltaproteobacteria bacterium]
MGKLTGTPPSGPKAAADSKRPAQAGQAPVAQSSHAVRSPKIISGAPQKAAGKAPAAATKPQSPSASKKAAPKKNDAKKRAFLATLGAGLLVFAMLKFQSESGDTGAGASFATREQAAEVDESMRVFTPLGEDTFWSNPEQGIIERNFCRGNQNSAGCSHAPLHPFSEEFSKAGWSEKEYAKYLGWDKYPREDRNRVISETVTYENKAFKFR